MGQCVVDQCSSGVPLLDLGRQYQSIRAEVLVALTQVCDSQQFILGKHVEQLEEWIANYCGVKHAIGVSSGTDALIIALMEAGVGVGDEVITTPFSFFATASCIARLGALPVFVDIDPVSFCIDPSKVASKLSKRTKAIIPVHLYGQAVAWPELRDFAKANNLCVIEDAAQAIGASYMAQKTGSLGDMGCFSFFPSKNLGGFGDGGMVVTNSSERASRLKALRVHGSNKQYFHEYLGGNFRLDALQAAVLQVKCPYLDLWAQGRRENAKLYGKYFVDSGLATNDGSSIIVLPTEADGCHHVYNQYVIRCEKRDELKEYLGKQRIGVQIYYPLGLHMQPCFSYLGYHEGDFPECEKATKQCLALPIFPELTVSEIELVVSVIAEFYKSH